MSVEVQRVLNSYTSSWLLKERETKALKAEAAEEEKALVAALAAVQEVKARVADEQQKLASAEAVCRQTQAEIAVKQAANARLREEVQAIKASVDANVQKAEEARCAFCQECQTIHAELSALRSKHPKAFFTTAHED